MTPERRLTEGAGATDNGVSACRCSEVAVLSHPADRGGEAARAAPAVPPRGRRRRCARGDGCRRGGRDTFTRGSCVSIICAKVRWEGGGGHNFRSLGRRQICPRPTGRSEDALPRIAAAGGSATDRGARAHGTRCTAVLRVPEALRAVCSASRLAGAFVGRGGGQL